MVNKLLAIRIFVNLFDSFNLLLLLLFSFLSLKFGNSVDVLLLVIDMIFGLNQKNFPTIYILLSFCPLSRRHSHIGHHAVFPFCVQYSVQVNENCVNTMNLPESISCCNNIFGRLLGQVEVITKVSTVNAMQAEKKQVSKC